MKRIFIALVALFFIGVSVCEAKPVVNEQTNLGMKMYKEKNYTECLQIMFDVVNDDPSNVLAYYYIAISQARLGKTQKAKEAYQRVIDINTSTQLSNYSENGIACLDNPENCRTEANMDPTKRAMDSVNKQLEEKKIDTVRDIVNQKQNIQEVPIEYMKDFKDFSKPVNQKQNKVEAPTQNEIAQALDVLKRAGYQNYMPQPAMTPEMVQMSMLNSMNANNQGMNNPMASFMPYMLNHTPTSQMDPQLMQTMMMSSMMNGLYDDFDNK